MSGGLVDRMRRKADEIASEVARTEQDIRDGAFGEIELLREGADEIERLGLKLDKASEHRSDRGAEC